MATEVMVEPVTPAEGDVTVNNRENGGGTVFLRHIQLNAEQTEDIDNQSS